MYLKSTKSNEERIQIDNTEIIKAINAVGFGVSVLNMIFYFILFIKIDTYFEKLLEVLNK